MLTGGKSVSTIIYILYKLEKPQIGPSSISLCLAETHIFFILELFVCFLELPLYYIGNG
jgi:hypothetical protein